MSQKRNKDLIIIGISWIIVSIPVLILLYPQIDEMVQTEVFISLVFITWFYAKQTQKQTKFSKSLLDEQKLRRVLEFNERRLQSFYNPFFEHLDEVFNVFDEKRIEEIRESLETVKREIFWPHYFMLQKETREIVGKIFPGQTFGSMATQIFFCVNLKI